MEAMLPVVSDADEFSSLQATTEEKARRAAVWAKILIGIIPEERLPEAFALAVRLHKTSFPVCGYDIKLAWEQIEAAELKKQAEIEKARLSSNPVLACKNAARHINGSGDVHINLFNTERDDRAPCPVCRAAEYAAWRKTQIALSGEHPPRPIVIPAARSTPDERMKPLGTMFRAAIEEIVSPGAAEALAKEHNDLVTRIVDDKTAIKNLLLIYDEGGGCFKYPGRADITFSVKAIRRNIDDYKRILKERGERK